MNRHKVAALTVFSGELIAGGNFATAGGVPCNNVARWNGDVWGPLGSGMDGDVIALTVYNGDLIAGGDFTVARSVSCNHIVRRSGSTWQPLGSGMDGPVNALTVYDGELIAGGRFTTAGGVPCNYIARWDGSTWHTLGSGMQEDYAGRTEVLTLTVYNGDLIAGGRFGSAGGVPCSYVARWNGSGWQALGSGVSEGYSDFPAVFALTAYDGKLIAAGQFLGAGGASCNYIASWDGSEHFWSPLGSGLAGPVRALTVLQRRSYRSQSALEREHLADAWAGNCRLCERFGSLQR